jgi:DNA polymerase I-like protein with 3'-5' exonuclease and polymerase domains
MSFHNSQKADFKKQAHAGYIPYYPDHLGWVRSPQKLGFKCNAAVLKVSNYDEVVRMVQEADFVSLDTETTGLNFVEADVISINVGLPGNNNFVGFYYQGFFNAEQKSKLVTTGQLDELVRLILEKPVCFMWNRYFDQRVLMFSRGFREGQFWRCYDGLDLLWLLDSNVKQGLGLKKNAQEYLGLPNWGQEDDFWEDILTADPRVLISYGAMDAYATLELGIRLYHIHKKHYPFMLQLHIECKNALFRLEEQGQVLDGPYLREVEQGVTQAIEEVKAEFYARYGILNLGSPRQKSDLLLRLGWSTGVWNKPAKDGSKIMSTAGELLEALIAKGCEPAKLMVRYAKLLKLESSYLKPMREAVDSGRPVRFHFKDHDVQTLRFSAGAYRINRKPYHYFLPVSLQCLPKPHRVNRELNYDPKTFAIEWPAGGVGQYYVETGAPELNVRKAVCASPGGKIVKADFAQQELVIAAVLSNETTWLDAIKNGRDLHKATGRLVYGRDITGEERKEIKGYNFGLLYEIENPEWVLANSTGWSIERCREFMVKYKAALGRLYAWKDKVIMEGRSTGSIKNLYGFERRVYGYYHTANRRLHKLGDKTCANQSVQGLAGIMMRIILVKCWKAFDLPGGQFYGSGVRVFAPIHDEFDLFVPDASILPELLPAFQGIMESVTPPGWPVKLRAELEVGDNMGETFVVGRDPESGLWLPHEEARPAVVGGVSDPVVSTALIDDWVEETGELLEEAAGFSF